MKLNRLILLILVFGSCNVSATGFGTHSDLPIDITADSSDSALGDGVTILKKNVHIKQGELEIIADLGKIHTSDSKVVRIELEGTPVTWHQQLPEGGTLDAQASSINYEVEKAEIVLLGDVKIKHPQGEIKGHRVRYDLNNERFFTRSAGGDDRVHFRINPTQKDTAPNSSKPAEDQVEKDQTEIDQAKADQTKKDQTAKDGGVN
ncbi:MAG: lipopolysaccharide transport periplasmic protein LptA [Xanthomonadales bacterium]|nr:lipopolysaccharide transport periplasmic protein LptA [Xanthomonadales bacterium]